MSYLIGSIIAFSLIILIHEGGHFIVAKWVGMKVNEFSLGMGPKLFAFQKGETLYSIRALPIGGFIRPEGEDEESDHPRAFGKKPLWARTAVVSAGPISNFLLAFLIIVLLLTFVGIPSITIGEAIKPTTPINTTAGLMSGDVISEVNGKQVYIFEEFVKEINNSKGEDISLTVIRDGKEVQLSVPTVHSDIINQNIIKLNTVSVNNISPDKPAANFDIRPGDIIAKANGKNIYVASELSRIVDKSEGSNVSLTVFRDGRKINFNVPTEYSEEAGRYLLGIHFASRFDMNFHKYSFLGNFERSFSYSSSLFKQIGSWFKRLFAGKVSKDEVGGPVKIVSITGQVAQMGVSYFIHFIALLSLSLGIVNLFPIPALDGGRLVFFAIEGIRGKPLDPKKEAAAHFVGFVLLITLLIVVTYNDIMSL